MSEPAVAVSDATIVNIALPSAQRDLAFTNADRQWVVTAYSLAFGGLLLLGGRLSDLAPAALSTLTTTFTDPAERGKAFGVYGAIAGAGGAVGLLLGGTLTEYLPWRWCLYVNVALAVVAVAGAVRLLTAHPRDPDVHIDWPGTVLVVAGLLALVYGLSEADTKGWGAVTTDVLLAAGAIGLSAIGVFGIFLFLTYYLQETLGYSPVTSGLAFLPMIAGIVAASTTCSGVLMPRFGPRPLIPAGLTLAAGGRDPGRVRDRMRAGAGVRHAGSHRPGRPIRRVTMLRDLPPDQEEMNARDI